MRRSLFVLFLLSVACSSEQPSSEQPSSADQARQKCIAEPAPCSCDEKLPQEEEGPEDREAEDDKRDASASKAPEKAPDEGPDAGSAEEAEEAEEKEKPSRDRLDAGTKTCPVCPEEEDFPDGGTFIDIEPIEDEPTTILLTDPNVESSCWIAHDPIEYEMIGGYTITFAIYGPAGSRYCVSFGRVEGSLSFFYPEESEVVEDSDTFTLCGVTVSSSRALSFTVEAMTPEATVSVRLERR